MNRLRRWGILILLPFICMSTAPALFGEEYSLFPQDPQIFPYRYAGDMLFLFPGIFVRDIGHVGQWSSFRIRGSNDNQTLLLLDGRPMIDPWTGRADLNWIPEEAIDRIEVYSGMNPTGYSAAGGIINFISRKTTGEIPLTRVVYRSGSQSLSDLDVSFNQSGPKWRFSSGVLMRKYAEDLDDRRYQTQKTRIGFAYHPSQSIWLEYKLLHNNSSINLPYFSYFPGDTAKLTEPHFKFSRYDHSFEGNLNLRTPIGIRISRTTYDFVLRNNLDHSKEAYPVAWHELRIAQKLDSLGLPIQWILHGSSGTLRDGNQNRTLNSLDITASCSIPIQKNWAARIQGHTVIQKAIRSRALFGAQIFRNLGNASHVSLEFYQSQRLPNLGELFGNPLMVSLPAAEPLFSQGFFSPSISCRERSYIPQAENLLDYSIQSIPNPSLGPETAEQLQLTFQTAATVNPFLNFSVYHRTISDCIHPRQTNEGLQYQNFGNRTFFGIENQTWIRILKGFEFGISSAWNRTINSKTPTIECPEFDLRSYILLNHSFFQNDLDITLIVSGQFCSSYHLYDTSTQDKEDLVRIPENLWLNTKLMFQVIQNVVISYTIENLLDSRYERIPGYVHPGMINRIQISWNLTD